MTRSLRMQTASHQQKACNEEDEKRLEYEGVFTNLSCLVNTTQVVQLGECNDSGLNAPREEGTAAALESKTNLPPPLPNLHTTPSLSLHTQTITVLNKRRRASSHART